MKVQKNVSLILTLGILGSLSTFADGNSVGGGGPAVDGVPVALYLKGKEYKKEDKDEKIYKVVKDRVF